MININGVKFRGKNILIKNNSVIVGGKDATPHSKIININIVGDIKNLTVDKCETIIINGKVININKL